MCAFLCVLACVCVHLCVCVCVFVCVKKRKGMSVCEGKERDWVTKERERKTWKSIFPKNKAEAAD